MDMEEQKSSSPRLRASASSRFSLSAWLKLFAGLAVAALFITSLHLLTALAQPKVVLSNRDKNIDATPLFYSEVCDISEFFAPEGKYYIDLDGNKRPGE